MEFNSGFKGLKVKCVCVCVRARHQHGGYTTLSLSHCLRKHLKLESRSDFNLARLLIENSIMVSWTTFSKFCPLYSQQKKHLVKVVHHQTPTIGNRIQCKIGIGFTWYKEETALLRASRHVATRSRYLVYYSRRCMNGEAAKSFFC